MRASPILPARQAADRALRAVLAILAFACDWWMLPVGVLIIVGLMGCAATQTAPGMVKVPVSVPCQTQIPPRPVFPADGLTGDEDLWTLGTTLWADRKARAAWEVDIETRLRGCIEAAP